MKKISVLLLMVLVAVASCKKKESPAPAAGTYPLNQLTGIKYNTKYDSAGYQLTPKYAKWTFSGTNPITATPVTDDVHFGQTTMYFTGANATTLVLSHDTFNFRTGTSARISYNADNLPDTIRIDYPYSFSPYPNALDRAYVFEYTGKKVTRIIKAASAGFPHDTLNWASPNCYYYYTYNGENVSQVVTQYWPTSPSTYSTTTAFSTSTHKNNLAKAMPQYLLLEFMAAMNGQSDFPDHLPFYLSENMIVYAGYTHGPTEFTYVTDSKGRITEMVCPGYYVFDTTFYYY